MNRCRLCLKMNELMHSIFQLEEMETEAVTLAMKITICTAVPVLRTDNLPQQICQICHDFIAQWYSFRQKCQEADKRLRTESVQNNDSESDLEPLSKIASKKSVATRKRYAPYRRQKIPLAEDSNKEDDSCGPGNRIAIPDCCGQKFETKISYRMHISEVHPGEKLYFCDICGKKGFISNTTLVRHKFLHSRKFACKVCNKVFTCRALLRIHERDKHENDHPFVCHFCGKGYVTEVLLRYHQRFHTDERKYMCEVCGSSFVTSSSLAKHKRIHDGVKPHVCDVCGKGFVSKDTLVDHHRTHTGERPFECEVCGRRFSQKSKMTAHRRTHEASNTRPVNLSSFYPGETAALENWKNEQT